MNIIKHSGQLVVDSRLISERLGIKHKNFLETLSKYQTKIEQRFGQVAFETETVKNRVGAVNEVKYALLTESQATVLMTFSRNTEQVIECKLDLVESFEKAKTVISQQANLIDEMKLKIELAKLEATKAKAELAILDKRQYITTALPEPVQQKILGYTTVKEVEYRDRIVKDDEVLNAGDTINKTALCYRYGLLTRNGKPDYKKLNACLDNLKLPSEAWKLTAQIRENQELNRDYLEYLDRQLMGSDRQLWIGE